VIRLIILFLATSAAAQSYEVVPVVWSFSQSGQVMIVSAQFQASASKNYYLLRSDQLQSWSTINCIASTNFAMRSMTTQCPMNTTPRSYLRMIRGPYNADCCCTNTP
jgi:hypothetical protein